MALFPRPTADRETTTGLKPGDRNSKPKNMMQLFTLNVFEVFIDATEILSR